MCVHTIELLVKDAENHARLVYREGPAHVSHFLADR
jgi:hypothetical protein